ncbi:FAHD1 [Lepeophtheirus salmonis]|uniref:oxaloacetate tautomerase n=1 Tax=Lepeophtheirus salmonis TaxID=72036 RepID=A0A7R8HEC7_LEPSM|nr:FAHD1 [Lepeophtheirus salmonis]CAF3039533.1 FAHD1 [Lepeophtheirus salmonis]
MSLNCENEENCFGTLSFDEVDIKNWFEIETLLLQWQLCIPKINRSVEIMSNLSRFTKIGRKIVGVGRNYKAHAIELKNEVPSSPMLFLKPTSSYIQSGERIEIPLGCSEIHHEIELGVIIKEKCSRVSDTEAASYIGGYVLALDMTCRDFQRTAMAKGYPWAMAKGSCSASMLHYFTLEEGDLILTGTPEGVGPVRNGDVIRGTIPNVIDIEFIVGLYRFI